MSGDGASAMGVARCALCLSRIVDRTSDGAMIRPQSICVPALAATTREETMKLTHVLSLGALAALFCTVAVRAGGEKVAFPEGFAKGVLYTTVDRADNKQYRQLYAPKEAIDAVKAGQPLPSGTVITMVNFKAKLNA